MTARRPLVYALPVLGALIAAGIALASLRAGNQVDTFERLAGAAAGVGVFALGVFAAPAWTLSLAMGLTAFNGNWALMGVHAPIDRILLAAAAVGVVIRQVRSGQGLRTQPIHWLLLLSAAYALTSGVLEGTLSDRGTRFGLLDRFGLIPYAVFFLAPFAFRTARERRVLLGVLVLLGGYLGLTALFETTGPASLVIPHYISNPALGIHFGRARGPFLEANAMGLALFACGVAAVVAAVSWADRRARRLAWLLAALCALGILFTVTRGTWLGAIVGTLLALLATHRTRRVVLPVAATTAVLVVAAFLVIPGLQSRASSRLNDQFPIWDRKNSNAVALKMLAERPLFGFGLGEFQFASVDRYRQAADYPLSGVRAVHNVYLGYGSELGVIGGGLWLMSILLMLGVSLRRRGPPDLQPWRLGLIAVAVSWLVTSATEPLGFPFPALMVWLWAGVVYGGSRNIGGVVCDPGGGGQQSTRLLEMPK